jgi:hypothetical protein
VRSQSLKIWEKNAVVDPDVIKFKSQTFQFLACNYDLLKSALFLALVSGVGSIRSLHKILLRPE